MSNFESTIQVKGIERIKERLNSIYYKSKTRAPVVLAKCGHVIAGYQKVNCPVDTGRLRASIGNPSKDGVFTVNQLSVKVGTAVEYGPDVEFGTRSHVIKPRNKPLLAWPKAAVAQKVKFTSTGTKRGAMQYTNRKSGKLTTDIKKGEWIFAKRVVHPGTKGSHFMLKGATQSIAKINEILHNEVVQV